MGSGDPLIILHGLFGSSDNWQTLGRQFAEDYEVFLLDQRNHGQSPHDSEHDYEHMSDDLLEFIYDHQLTGANLLGHSMGGKTVMHLAQQHPELLHKIVVADMGVKAYPPHHEIVLETLASLKLTEIKSRKEADAIAAEKVHSPTIRQFLLKNLYWKTKGSLAWRLNLEVIIKTIDNLGISLAGSSDTEALFIYGGASDYILDDDKLNILTQFPQAEFYCLDEAGHWLHAEKPLEFYTAVMDFLD